MAAASIVAQKYRLGPEIGRGGMGSVFDATDVTTGGHVALKIMRAPERGEEAERERIGRFQREALVVGRLDTPHVVQVFDTGLDPETNELFIVMELLEGEDLSHLLKRIGPLRVDLAVAIIAQACMGLAKAHEAGIVHRDIKPGNLFLSRTASSEVVVKLLDFGVAKVRKVGDSINAEGMTLTQTGALVGSPFYMSPEQARGRKSVDHRADVWSLGIVLHKLLTGRTPFDGVSTLGEVIIAICSEEPTSLREHAPWAPELVVDVVHRALRRNPDERFQSALDMLEALRPLLPNGYRITRDMIGGLPPELRAELAALPRALDRSLSDAGAPSSQRLPPASSSSLPLDAPSPSSTSLPLPYAHGSMAAIDSAAGLSATRVDPPPPPPRSRVVHAVMAVSVALAVTGVGLGAFALKRTADHRSAANGGAPSAAAPPPSAPVLGLGGPSPSAAESASPAANASSPTASSEVVNAAPPRVGVAAGVAGNGGAGGNASRAHPRAQPAQPAQGGAASPPKNGASAPGRLSGGVGGDVPF